MILVNMGSNFLDSVFDFCCATMVEMGNLFHMSYQKINVILFSYVEQALFVMSIIAMLYVIFKGPGYVTVGKISLWIMLAIIAVVTIVLMISAIRVVPRLEEMDLYFKQIHNEVETSIQMRDSFSSAVDWLNRVAAAFNTTYETVNIWVYILIMPAGILTSIISIAKTIK